MGKVRSPRPLPELGGPEGWAGAFPRDFKFRIVRPEFSNDTFLLGGRTGGVGTEREKSRKGLCF